MAHSTSKSNFLSRFRTLDKGSHPAMHVRGYHVELGAREKAQLLEEDPALKRFKSYKNSVKLASKVGNALKILVVAACSYEILAAAVSKAV